MVPLIQTDTSTMGYYVIKFMSEPYTIQEEKMFDGKFTTAGEIVVKAQYMNCLQDNMNWYWEQKPRQNNIIVPTQTIISPCLDVTTATKIKNTKIVCDKCQAHRDIQRSHICLTDFDNDLILYEIKLIDTIKYVIRTSVDDRCE